MPLIAQLSDLHLLSGESEQDDHRRRLRFGERGPSALRGCLSEVARPAPLTDVGVVKVDKTPRLVRWGVEHLLPTLIANADREEMTMTALGAGTSLSTLHALDRAVLVLHGHKHYATARLLARPRACSGWAGRPTPGKA